MQRRPGPEAARIPSRRHLLRGGGGLLAVGTLGAGGLAGHRMLPSPPDPRTVMALHSDTVGMDGTGRRLLVPVDGSAGTLREGTRLHHAVPDEAAVARRSTAFQQDVADWRVRLTAALGDQPALVDLAGTALLDLWVLTDELPAPVAGWSRNWRYVWPRDAAFVAVALARVGRGDQALGILEHLQQLQGADGWFEARYVPGTAQAPDDRPRQFDGTGLLLWAAAELAGHAPPGVRDEVTRRLEPLITASLGTLLGATGDGRRLPPVSPDYWEHREHQVTLGIMTATLTGLRAGAELTGDPGAAAATAAFRELLHAGFGPRGFQRHPRGGGADSALAFLDATGVHDVVGPGRLTALRRQLARPAGGIAPGADWKRDGISWTPSTSLLGLALARAGEHAAAAGILHWIARHRTPAGSIPEKVLHDGAPAAVAPLAWSAANVLLTLDELTAR